MEYNDDSDPFGYLDDDVDVRAFGKGAVFGDDDEEVGEEAAFEEPSGQGAAFKEPSGQGAAFDDIEDSINARKNQVAQIAQANRDAASLEERELATRLRVTPIASVNHLHNRDKNKNNCIACAKSIANFYVQNGSNIDFAMIDSRWPTYICKHLIPRSRCSKCYGVSLCVHNVDKYRCPKCGNAMCRDPAHEVYRKNKPLRKSNCPGCKEAKKEVKGISKGGSTKRKYSLSKRKKYSMKNGYYALKSRKYFSKNRNYQLKKRFSKKK